MDIFQLLPSLASTIATDRGFGSDVIQMFFNAGPVVKLVLFILIAFSVTSWTIIFIKLRFFRNARQETDYFLDVFWDSTDLTEIYKESKELIYSPVAQMFKRGYTELVRIKKMQLGGASKGSGSLRPLKEHS